MCGDPLSAMAPGKVVLASGHRPKSPSSSEGHEPMEGENRMRIMYEARVPIARQARQQQ